MRKNKFLVAVLMVLSLVFCLAAGCVGNEPEPTLYTITVTGGTADKTSAEEGETVTLTPGEAPAGSEFAFWTVNDERIEGNSFEMPAKNTTVAATYNKLSYTITVTGGTADKTTAKTGDTVTLTIGTVAEGKQFDYWTLNGEKIEGNTFTMPAGNASVEAVLKDIEYTITVTGGTADKESAPLGATVTLTPGTVVGSTFSHWLVNDERIEGNSFVMKAENAIVVAVFVKDNYTVTVTGGTADKETAQYGDTVTLTVGEIAEGKQFDYWTLNGEKIEGNTFTMPAGNASVEAVLKDIEYTITVTGGTADKESAPLGATVTLTPGTVVGSTFSHWLVNDERIEGNSFVMKAENAIVVAVFDKTDYTVTVTGGSSSHTTANYEDEVTLTANEAPEGKEFYYWSVNGEKIEGNTFTMPAENAEVVAHYAALVKIATPDNSRSRIIFKENDSVGTAIAIDRIETMITEHTDYVLFYIFDAPDATEPLGSVKFTVKTLANTANTGNISSMDGTLRIDIHGGPGNYYTVDPAGFFAIINHEIGYKYGEGITYYFAAKVFAKTNIVEVDGVDTKYMDSEMSEIGRYNGTQNNGNPTHAMVFDKSKPNKLLNITVENGLINGELTELTVGTGNIIKLTTEAQEGKLFAGWCIGDGVLSYAFSYDYKVSAADDAVITAKFVDETTAEKIVLPTLVNTDGNLIRKAANGAIEFDRVPGKPMFTTGVDYIKYYVYESAGAASDEYVGAFKVRLGGSAPFVGWIESLDGTLSFNILRGNSNNYYADTGLENFYGILSYELGIRYSAGKTYYYAAQACTNYVGTICSDGEISAIGENGFAENANVAVTEYTVTVESGTEGVQAEVFTGYSGATLRLTADLPEGKTYVLWYEVSLDGEEETLVYIGQGNGYGLELSKNMTVRPVFKTAEEVKKLDAPDNSDNQMIKFNGATIEYDRQKNEDGSKKTAFVEGVDYIRVYIYDSAAADARGIGSFKYMWDGNKFWLESMDGSKKFDGMTEGKQPGNFYSVTGEAHNFIKSVIPGYSADKAYYYAFQSVADDSGNYADSEIGAKGKGWVNI